MSLTKNPLDFVDFKQATKIALSAKTLAANAGSTEILSVPVARGTSAIVRGLIYASAGVVVAPFTAVADATADTLTAVAHGLVSGQPVYVVGTVQPGGVTATTVYYANAATADTIALYDTAAHAVSGGPTGLIDITTAGTAVVVTTTTVNAAYTILSLGHNRNNNLTAVGSASVVSVEDVSAWDVTSAADNTNKAVSIKATPDTALDTTYTGWFEVFTSPLVASN